MATEQEIRQDLGIPDAAPRVILFSQSSHLDWDWLESFPILCDDANTPYFNQSPASKPAFTIFDAAVALLQQNQTLTLPYYYSVAEVGFLQAYAESTAGRLQGLKVCGTLLHLCGGGITSPDNLLPHGEAFIRNFLVARQWYAANLGLPVMNAWMPDDFGHDSQLPVAVAAMGLAGAGFARIPGAQYQGPAATPVDGSNSLAQTLGPPINEGVDFRWAANDGSTILGHWMIDHYDQGDRIGSGNSNDNILRYYRTNVSSSPTPYIFVPVGSDFAMPQAGLLTYMNDWNSGSGPASYAGTGAWAVAATFDHYIQLISFHAAALKTRQPFDAIPYWLGHYASRPANKILHYSASRTLVAAEVMGVVADVASGAVSGGNAARLAREQAAWAALVPSTHHDYITGTSGAQFMDVNAAEQLPRLRLSVSLAQDLLDDAIEELRLGINPGTAPNDWATPVVVCNPLGFPRTDLVSLPHGSGIGAVSLYNSSGNQLVQQSADGSLLFLASAPSLGYDTVFVNTRMVSQQRPAVSISNSGTTWTLANDLISVTLDQASQWGITSMSASGSTTSIIAPGEIGNALTFYDDLNGNLYRYGNETQGSNGMWPVSPVFTAGNPQVLETGPLRVVLQAQLTASFNNATFVYVLTYSLVAGEPFVRMEVSGATPSQTSVFVRFPFAAGSVASLARGTTYHWADEPMVLYWQPPVFWATHNFVIPKNFDEVVLAAVYQEGMPSWGYDCKGALLGNILRNNYDGSAPYGAGAWDSGLHTQRYALRIPDHLGDPTTGQPLQEALRFVTPMVARTVAPPPLSSNAYPSTYSVASVSSPSSAILTAAKAADEVAADLILRIYQPTNTAQSVELTTVVDASGATVRTALEDAFQFQQPNAAITSAGSGGTTVQMNNALATICLPGVL
jgi:alpha-mannosidase